MQASCLRLLSRSLSLPLFFPLSLSARTCCHEFSWHSSCHKPCHISGHISSNPQHMKRMGYCGIKLQLAAGNLQQLQHFSPLICKNASGWPHHGEGMAKRRPSTKCQKQRKMSKNSEWICALKLLLNKAMKRQILWLHLPFDFTFTACVCVVCAVCAMCVVCAVCVPLQIPHLFWKLANYLICAVAKNWARWTAVWQLSYTLLQ